MDELRPFDLTPVGDGCYELRAFSDDSDDPIRIRLDESAGRELSIALGDALVSLDDPRAVEREFHVAVGQRKITVLGWASPHRDERMKRQRGWVILAGSTSLLPMAQRW